MYRVPPTLYAMYWQNHNQPIYLYNHLVIMTTNSWKLMSPSSSWSACCIILATFPSVALVPMLVSTCCSSGRLDTKHQCYQSTNHIWSLAPDEAVTILIKQIEGLFEVIWTVVLHHLPGHHVEELGEVHCSISIPRQLQLAQQSLRLFTRDLL